MSNPVQFNRRYFIPASSLFIAEVLIALLAHDRIVRPYFGDFLVVILIYCFVKSFINTPVVPTALSVLAFSYIVEVSQLFNFVTKLGLKNSRLARIIMGSSFAWTDLIMYTAGIALVLYYERLITRRDP